MARRRKTGTRKYAIVGLAIVLLAVGGLFFSLANEDFTLFDEIILGGLFNTGEIDSSSESFGLPPLSLVDFGVDCTIRFVMVAINVNGQNIKTINSGSSTSPLFADLSLVARGGSTTDFNTIKEYQLTPKIKCAQTNNPATSGTLGYFLPHPQQLTYTVTTTSPTGVGITVGTFLSPKFSHGDLGINVERTLSTLTIPASVIDGKLPPYPTVYDSRVGFYMGGQLNFGATGFGTAIVYPYFTGTGGVLSTNHLISVDKIGGQEVEGVQFVRIDFLRRVSDNTDLMSGANKINSLTQDVRESSVRVLANLADFRLTNPNEAFPMSRILQCLDTTCNTNRQIVSSTGMTRQSSGDSFLNSMEVPRGAEEGQYAVEVKSTDRSQVAKRFFYVEHLSVTCPDPTETLIGGVCVPIAEPMCSAGYSGTPPNCVLIDTSCPAGQSGTQPNCVVIDTTCDLTEADIRALSDADLGLAILALGVKQDDSGLTGCEGQALLLMKSDLIRRGFVDTTTCASDETGTPPNCVKTTTASGAVGKIEYDAKYVATGTTTTQGCRDTGTIPTSGVSLQSFGLIAGGGTCGGNQFGSIDIRPIIDFVGQTVVVDRTSVKQDARIWVSVNNPFPASPEWGTGDVSEVTSTCRITGKELPTSCLISNHDFTKDTKETSFAFGQFVPVTEFRSGTTIYDIALITLSSAEIEKKVTDAGFQLKDGDNYSFLVQFVTKMKVQIGGTFVDVVVPATAVHYSFTYAESPDITCDLTKSFIETTCLVINQSTGEQQCTDQCKPRDSICTDGTPKVNNQCPAPVPPNVICPEGLVPPDFIPFTANQCVQPKSPVMCDAVPTCGANEQFAVTGTTDSCGFEILTCVPITPTTDDCPSTEIRNQDGVCVPKGEDIVPPNPTGGCNVGYDINIFGNCQRIGSGTGGNGGGGGGTDDDNVNFCAVDKFFENPSRCFSQIFAGADSLTAGGEPDEELTGLLTIAVLVIIIIVIIAVAIRLKRGGGFNP